jgi:hypothetical protein
MSLPNAPLLTLRSNYGFKLLLLFAVATSAVGAAESVHGWGLVDWGMTEAQVQAAYGDGVEELPPVRNGRTELVEALRLKNPLVINGVSLAPTFAFSRANKGLERVVLRTRLTNASSEQCQGTYGRLRQSEIKELAEPVEEKSALRSLHAIWHGRAADAQLSILDVTGHCFVTLVYRRPSPPSTPAEGNADAPADNPQAPVR